MKYKYKDIIGYIIAIFLVMSAFGFLYISGHVAKSQTPQLNPQPTFSYASSYPPFGVTTGSGPIVPNNWNVFGIGEKSDDIPYMFIFEPLAYADFMTGQLYPWLATNWTFTDNNTNFIVYLRHGVYFYYNGTWTNGSQVQILWPFTAKDVLVSFQDYFEVYGNPFNVTVTEINPYEVDFHFGTPNVQYALYDLLEQFIVPWEQYANLSNPASAVIPIPVGTGPYYLAHATATEAVLYRNPYYWIPGRPFIPALTYYVAVSNSIAYGYLAKGVAQWGGTGSTGSTPFSKLFAYANPQYYFGMASIGNGSGGQPSFLWINFAKLNYWPWNETWFRYALSLALNRTQISIGSQFGITTGAPPTPADFLPSPMEQIWLNSTIIQEAHQVDQYNLTEAIQILESHGLKIINGKLSFPNGTPLPPVTIINYQGFSDTFATSELIAQDLQQIGLQISVISETPSNMFASEDNGQYDLIYWLTNAYTPYYVWEYAFIPPLIPGTDQPNVTALQTIGVPIYTDPGRWIPPKEFIDLWIQAGDTTNVTLLKQIYNKMAAILIKDLPAIPVVFDAYPRYEYEDQYYIGFSTPQYFYTWNVEPWIYGNVLMLLNIAPRPPGMTQQQEIQYTQTAWQDLLNYINGKATTATPQSLLNMLQPTVPLNTSTSTTSTSTTTPLTTTTTSTSTTPISTSTSTTTSSSGLSIGVIVGIVVVVIVVIVVVAFVALRRR
ncbi:ABC transporter substrate-binding protein [Sulfolobus tengchongensis]|uniref:ABC transporter substrate-binding protein n=1 Tax=Sulfolobus tengchongensis TaxID=207809 RepID=A0AAX4L3K9_9CREN